MYASLVFNEVVGLHVHNQQEYKLVVDHEFRMSWDGNGLCMPWWYTLEQPRMRVTLWFMSFLTTSGGCVMTPQ